MRHGLRSGRCGRGGWSRWGGALACSALLAAPMPAQGQSFAAPAPVVSVSFDPAEIRLGGTSTLTVTIRNLPGDTLFVSGQLALGNLPVAASGTGGVVPGPGCDDTDGEPNVAAGPNGLALDIPFLLLQGGTQCSLSIATAPATEAGSYPVPALPGVFENSGFASQQPVAYQVEAATLEVVAGPILLLSPTAVIFPPTPLGAVSAERLVAATNAWDLPLSIATVAVDGEFRFASDCAGRTLAAGQSCNVSVASQPLRPGTRAGTLTVTSADPSLPAATAGLFGSGLSAPLLVEVSPTRVAFPPTADGLESAPLPVTLTNVSALPVAILAPRLDLAAFVVTDDCNVTLQPGQSCTLSARFRPLATGVAEALLRFDTNPPDAAGVALLNGEGLPAPARLRLLPDQATFLEQLVGTVSDEVAFRLVNEGNRPATVTAVTATGDFVVSAAASCSELAAGQSCAIGVRFAPTVAGERVGRLRVEALRAEGPVEALLLGLAQLTPTPRLSVSATALGFGSVLVGTASQSTAQLTNLGTGPLTLRAFSSSSPFQVAAGGCPGVLRPRESCPVALSFGPLFGGKFTGTATIDSDNPGGPVSISLSGTGCRVVISARGSDVAC